MDFILWMLVFVLSLLVGALVITFSGKSKPAAPPDLSELRTSLNALKSSVVDLPGQVLSSIQGSVNVHKGALGELIGYIQLRAQYDRIIPLGSIVDFVCIRFPSEDNEGCVDFIDIKTGGSSRLSKDQRNLQKLIQDKKIRFVKFTVSDIVLGSEDENLNR